MTEITFLGPMPTARCKLSAPLFAHQSRTGARPLKDEVDAAVLVVQGAAPFEALSDLLAGGLQLLAVQWRLSALQLDSLSSRLRSLIDQPAVFGPEPSDLCRACRLLTTPQVRLVFRTRRSSSPANGWPWSLALYLFAGVSLGSYCNCGFGFITSHGLKLAQESLRDGRWLVGHVHDQGRAGAPVSVLFDGSAVVFVQSSKSLRVGRPSPPPDRAVVAAQRRTRDYVRLPVDSDGNLVLPELLVTSIVERRLVWARLIQMNGVTRSLVNGKLACRRISSLVTASWLPKHRSWEDQDVTAVQPVLEQKLTTWFYQGALEYVLPGAPPPTVVEPKAAVPNKRADKYRDITDSWEVGGQRVARAVGGDILYGTRLGRCAPPSGQQPSSRVTTSRMNATFRSSVGARVSSGAGA